MTTTPSQKSGPPRETKSYCRESSGIPLPKSRTPPCEWCGPIPDTYPFSGE
eukprot:CAMPEP_0180353868 /NCGR_PEP_ID=MMETSP0989-20121125/7882_1 /TAXON_ID=697907 /ORGANISM="non described non described, Strain CCMP2293" /LENGTH=50 /DNA_ID=CAMNT_0022343587 /DNA_START=308 /DNA_END=460 /DNA_ORIENTATION=-